MLDIFVTFIQVVMVAYLGVFLWHVDRDLMVTTTVVSLLVSVLLYVAGRLNATAEDDPEIEFEYEDEDEPEDE